MTDFSHLKPGDVICWSSWANGDWAGVVLKISAKGKTMRVVDHDISTGEVYGAIQLHAEDHKPVKVNISVEELCRKVWDLHVRKKHALQQIREEHAERVAKMLEESQ